MWASTRRAKVIMPPGAVCKMKSSMGEPSCLLSCIQEKSEKLLPASDYYYLYNTVYDVKQISKCNLFIILYYYFTSDNVTLSLKYMGQQYSLTQYY